MSEYKKVVSLNKEGKLTEGESVLLDAIMDYLSLWEPYSEPGYSNLSVGDLSDVVGASSKELRGTLSSLVKKEYVEVFDVDVNFEIHNIVYITEITRGLYD